MIYELGERKPTFKGDYFVAQNAAVIGSVVFEPNASVWWGVTIRADNDVITLGNISTNEPTIPLATPLAYDESSVGSITNGPFVSLAVAGNSALPQDWTDLLKPEYKNSVALAGDPLASNQAQQSVYAAALSNGGSLTDATKGIEFFASLAKAGNRDEAVALLFSEIRPAQKKYLQALDEITAFQTQLIDESVAAAEAKFCKCVLGKPQYRA